MSLLLIVLIIALVFVAAPVGPVAGWHHYGWGPSGGILGIVLVVVLILFLLGRI